MAPTSGESLHLRGADGALRAKRWLESTTRVNAHWVNPHPEAVSKLQFSWPHGGQTFSYDLGGTLLRGDLGGQMFFAEVKNYSKGSDLGSQYREYLAKCYVALADKPAFCDNFMWISWHPHSITRWSELCSADYVVESVLEQSARVFGIASKKDATSVVDRSLCEDVARRLWLIVLSERQEKLVISPEHRGVIEKYEIQKSGGGGL